MAGNDINYMIHLIYEKFTENQKNKKQADRVYMSENEFTQDLEEFIVKSKIEDKNLLVYEIYRNVSNDALELSSDGTITVSPKVLKRVEREIFEKKERLTDKKNELESKDIKDYDSMEKISSEEFKKLSFEEKVELVSKAIEKFSESTGLTYDQEDIESLVELDGEVVSETLSNDEDAKKKQVSEWLNGSEIPLLNEFGNRIYDLKKILLEKGPCHELFVIDGKFDLNLFRQVMLGLENDDTLDINKVYLDAWKNCGYEENKAKKIFEKIYKSGISVESLKWHMAALVDTQAQIKELEGIAENFNKLSPEDRLKEEEKIRTMIKVLQEMQEEFGSENINLESLEETSRNFNNQRTAIKPKNHEKAINSRKKIKDANEAAIRSAKGEKIKEEELSVGGKKVFEKLEGQRTGSKKKLVIKSGSVRTINGTLTNLDRKQIRLKEKTPLDFKKAYKEGSTIYDPARDIGDSEIGTLFDKAEEIQFKKSTVEKDNSDMQVEKIDVVKPEEKFIPQVEEQGVEISNRELENKLPKELTWADRAKQSLFKIGKKIGNVVKAITSKDSSKGVLERITNAIHLDSNSNYDNGSNSTTSTTDASTATEKIEEAHIDYLNMQFKVDINQALQNTKDAAEKAAQRTDSSTELAEDGERQ